MCTLFAATYPARTSALVMLGSYARLRATPDHPWGRKPDDQKAWLDRCQCEWAVRLTSTAERQRWTATNRLGVGGRAFSA